MTESDEKTYGPLLPLKEGAKHLGISERTLREKAQLGEVETHKLFGRRLISEDEIIRLIEESRVLARGKARPRVNLAGTARGRGSR
jgi:Helix-turn-helix domain